MHGSVEDTKLSTNKQHSLSLEASGDAGKDARALQVEVRLFPVNWKPKLIKLKTTNNLTNQGL